MKNILMQERGVSLVSLAAVIIVIGIITSILLYSVGDTKDVEKITKLYSDIENLEGKVSTYYSKYGAIPAMEKQDISNAISEIQVGDDNPVGANDTGDFLLLDLNALENLTLNYGKGFENVKESESIGNERDLYVINKTSHNIIYLKGIKVDNHYYYTNQDKDTEKIDLRFVDGIKIIDGYKYKSGDKNNNLKIVKSNDATIEYTWINLENGTYELNEDTMKLKNLKDTTQADQTLTLATGQTKADFLLCVKQYKGFYLGTNGAVLYITLEESEKWSDPYDVKSTYKDEYGNTAGIPAGFCISLIPGMDTIQDGLVAKKGNVEYVFISVPDYVFENADTLHQIETSLINYAGAYRESGYEDSWFDGCGMSTRNQYNELKENILTSIKENKGFWISRNQFKENSLYQLAYIIQDLATNNNGISTTSLMLGIQWDLVCKFRNGGDKNINDFADGIREWTLETNTLDASKLGVIRDDSTRTKVNVNSVQSSDNLAYRTMIY